MKAWRVRLAIVVIAAAPGLTGAASSAPGPTRWAATAVPLGPVQQNNHVWVGGLGRDNGQSAGLDGRSYWLFGDTLERTDAPGVQFVDNTGAMTTDLDGSDGIRLTSSGLNREDPDGVPQQIIALSPRERAFEKKHSASTCTAAKDPYCASTFAIWPGVVLADPARHRLLTFYNKLCRGGATQCTSGFAGTGIGVGVAAIDSRRSTVTRLRASNADVPSPEGTDPTLLFGNEGGSGSAVISGGYLYDLLDCTGAEFRCRVGRVPLASLMDRYQWEFFVGTSHGKAIWDPDLRRGTRVARSGAAGGTIQWVPGMRSFLNIYMLPLSNDLVYQVAPAPWGPWTEPQTLLTTPQGGSGPNYAGFSHPEYARDKGLTQYVTYYNTGNGMISLVKARFCPATGVVTLCT